jgi:hypothetical protein
MLLLSHGKDLDEGGLYGSEKNFYNYSFSLPSAHINSIVH